MNEGFFSFCNLFILKYTCRKQYYACYVWQPVCSGEIPSTIPPAYALSVYFCLFYIFPLLYRLLTQKLYPRMTFKRCSFFFSFSFFKILTKHRSPVELDICLQLIGVLLAHVEQNTLSA